MKGVRWQFLLAFVLVILSVVLYLSHYAVFEDTHHIFIFLLSDLAFVPMEVLIVTLIIHRLLRENERRQRIEKLKVVIGTFFSGVGTKLLTYFSDFDPGLDSIRQHLVVRDDWSDQEYDEVARKLRAYDYTIDVNRVDLPALKEFLVQKKDLLLRILENPTLLEHESFTDLMQAVFHLSEELESRDDLTDLPESDRNHLANDIRRAYVLLVREWLDYLRYLKGNYPYLFSLAIRLNPFDLEASPLVR